MHKTKLSESSDNPNFPNDKKIANKNHSSTSNLNRNHNTHLNTNTNDSNNLNNKNSENYVNISGHSSILLVKSSVENSKSNKNLNLNRKLHEIKLSPHKGKINNNANDNTNSTNFIHRNNYNTYTPTNNHNARNSTNCILNTNSPDSHIINTNFKTFNEQSIVKNNLALGNKSPKPTQKSPVRPKTHTESSKVKLNNSYYSNNNSENSHTSQKFQPLAQLNESPIKSVKINSNIAKKKGVITHKKNLIQKTNLPNKNLSQGNTILESAIPMNDDRDAENNSPKTFLTNQEKIYMIDTNSNYNYYLTENDLDKTDIVEDSNENIDNLFEKAQMGLQLQYEENTDKTEEIKSSSFNQNTNHIFNENSALAEVKDYNLIDLSNKAPVVSLANNKANDNIINIANSEYKINSSNANNVSLEVNTNSQNKNSQKFLHKPDGRYDNNKSLSKILEDTKEFKDSGVLSNGANLIAENFYNEMNNIANNSNEQKEISTLIQKNIVLVEEIKAKESNETLSKAEISEILQQSYIINPNEYSKLTYQKYVDILKKSTKADENFNNDYNKNILSREGTYNSAFSQSDNMNPLIFRIQDLYAGNFQNNVAFKNMNYNIENSHKNNKILNNNNNVVNEGNNVDFKNIHKEVTSKINEENENKESADSYNQNYPISEPLTERIFDRLQHPLREKCNISNNKNCNTKANPVLNNDTISCSSLYIDYNVANIEIRNLLLNEQGNHNQKDKEEDDGKKELSNVEEQTLRCDHNLNLCKASINPSNNQILEIYNSQSLTVEASSNTPKLLEENINYNSSPLDITLLKIENFLENFMQLTSIISLLYYILLSYKIQIQNS